MKKIIQLTFMALLSTVFLISCKSTPVYNVENSSTISGVSIEKVKKAIYLAGAGLGWSMSDKGRGKAIGTLHLRSHVAVVDITYDNKTYSINYKDSQNLGYENGNIHSNYNGWIQNLNKAIQVNLSIL